MKKMILLRGTVMLVFLLGLSQAAMAEDFPYRKKYPDTIPIETETLYQQYKTGRVVIVDVRSDIEYNVIHPKGAIHIPVGQLTFDEKAKEVFQGNPGKSVAFYCNGVTCLKSYEATRKAQEIGCRKCFVYDAGIPDWVEKYPAETLLLGKTVVAPEAQVIPKSEFKKRCLDFESFRQKAAAPNTIVIDARDHIQSSGTLPGLEKALKMPFSKLIPNFIEKKLEQDKTLLIFDQVGKQVRWLMYYLVNEGYTDYFFLDKGATGILKKQEYK